LKLQSRIPAIYPLLIAIPGVIFLLIRFNQVGGFEFRILFVLLLFIFGGVTLIGAYSYWKCFRNNRHFLGHGIAFVMVMLISLTHVVDFVFGEAVRNSGLLAI